MVDLGLFVKDTTRNASFDILVFILLLQECQKSICEKIGWQQCSPTSDEVDTEQLCFVACQSKQIY